MDKRYLDPRRPLGTPTKEDQAEMLVPYDVELPLAPQLFATHQQQVANLRGALLPNLSPQHRLNHCPTWRRAPVVVRHRALDCKRP